MSSNQQHSEFWPGDNPAVLAHVTLIQGIINRLAGASASCKTWCVTLVSGLLSLAGATHVPALATVALLPVCIFGFLDTMYLAQERAYRDLHGRIVKLIRAGQYGRDEMFNAAAPIGFMRSLCAFKSWSVWPVYLGLIGIYIAARTTGWMQLLLQSVQH
jgi:hypothetical protein